MIELAGKTIKAVSFKNYGECEVPPDYCDAMVIAFTDGSSLSLVGESSQDQGYIEVTISE